MPMGLGAPMVGPTACPESGGDHSEGASVVNAN